MTGISLKFSHGEIARGLLVAVVLILAGLAAGCDPGAEFTWVNETDRPIVVYLSGEFDKHRGSTILPHSSKTEVVITAVWNDLVVVRDEQGNVLLREEITWDEAKARDFRFVIRPEDLAPTPVGGP